MTILKGKVALVTGGSTGIGAATGAHLAAAGVTTVLAARRKDRVQATADSLSAAHGDATVVALACDVGRFGDCESAVATVLDRFGRIDILVNNAGVGYSGTIVETDPTRIDEMVRINLLGVFHMTRAVLPSMVERTSGDIVNIGSVAGLKYSPDFAMYSATKFAVRAFTEALRNEVQEHRIRVTLIHPGMTRTPFFDAFAKGGSPVPLDQGDLLPPEAIAETIVFALGRPQNVAVNEVTVRPYWQVR